MRLVLSLACWLALGMTYARADEDALEQGRRLLGGPQAERGKALLAQVIAEAKKGPESARNLLRAGRAHFYLEHDHEALAALERAAKLEPKNADVAYWQGVVLQYQDDGEGKALAAFQRAVSLDPKHGLAWLELGRLHSRRHEAREALEAHQRAAALLPDDATAHHLLAIELDGAARPAEARKEWERALQLNPDYVDAGYDLGVQHYLAGRFEAARDTWVGVEKHAPDDLQLHAKIVQAFFALQDYEHAAVWRARVLKIHETTKDEETRKRLDFCFDQFVVGDLRVLAYERFAPEPTKEHPIGYLYVFHVRNDAKGGDDLRRIQVEVSALAQELGGPPYYLCAVVGNEHRTYDVAWREPPPYPELKAAVLRAMRDELPAVASSRPGSTGAGDGSR